MFQYVDVNSQSSGSRHSDIVRMSSPQRIFCMLGNNKKMKHEDQSDSVLSTGGGRSRPLHLRALPREVALHVFQLTRRRTTSLITNFAITQRA